MCGPRIIPKAPMRLEVENYAQPWFKRKESSKTQKYLLKEFYKIKYLFYYLISTYHLFILLPFILTTFKMFNLQQPSRDHLDSLSRSLDIVCPTVRKSFN